MIKNQNESIHIESDEFSDKQAQHVTPFDLLNSKNYTNKDIRNKRYNICKGCKHFLNPVKMCKECGCNMPLKTWLKEASCPVGKW